MCAVLVVYYIFSSVPDKPLDRIETLSKSSQKRPQLNRNHNSWGMAHSVAPPLATGLDLSMYVV